MVLGTTISMHWLVVEEMREVDDETKCEDQSNGDIGTFFGAMVSRLSKKSIQYQQIWRVILKKSNIHAINDQY